MTDESMLQKAGLKELKGTAFVLVAGGLGERLGYSGIKVKQLKKIPISERHGSLDCTPGGYRNYDLLS